jgi:hypothetical protein
MLWREDVAQENLINAKPSVALSKGTKEERVWSSDECKEETRLRKAAI